MTDLNDFKDNNAKAKLKNLDLAGLNPADPKVNQLSYQICLILAVQKPGLSVQDDYQ